MFDSNPNSNDNGTGFAGLRQVSQGVYDLSSANDDEFQVLDSGTITVANHTRRLCAVKFSGTSILGLDDRLHFLNFDDIGAQALDASTATPSDANSITLRFAVGASVTDEVLYLSRGSGGHLIVAGSDLTKVPGQIADFTITVYEIF